MKDKVVRKYKISNNDVFITGGVFIKQFCENQEDFISYNPVIFHSDYAASIQLAIKNAQELYTDEYIVDTVIEKTETAKRKLKECREAYLEVKFYMMRAFPKNKAVWKQFGYSDYEKCKRTCVKMGEFMTLLHSASETYKTELIKIGYRQDKIDNQIILRDEMLEAKRLQMEAKKERLCLTNNRITLTNLVWDKIVDLCEAAKIIYRDNDGKRKIFALPKPVRKQRKTKSDLNNLSGS